MSGMEMLLINSLKAFMPKESAEKIAGWCADGTFDKIGLLPTTIEEIRRDLDALVLGQARIVALLQAIGRNDALYAIAPGGPVSASLAELGAASGHGERSASGSEPDAGRG